MNQQQDRIINIPVSFVSFIHHIYVSKFKLPNLSLLILEYCYFTSIAMQGFTNHIKFYHFRRVSTLCRKGVVAFRSLQYVVHL